MISPSSLPARVFRAALVGWSVAALAVVAHVVADGMAPPSLAVILVALVAAGTAMVLSQRQLTPTVLVALIGSAQLAVHLLGTYLTGPAHHVSPTIDSNLMFAAHAASTVATALLLAHGERVWWLVVSWLSGRGAKVQAHHRPSVRIRRLAAQLLQTSKAADLRHSVGLRGPPVLTQF